MDTKHCKWCTTTKPVSEFSFDAGKRLKSRCKLCENARMRAYRRANPEKMRALDRKIYARTAGQVRLVTMVRRYGITTAQAQAVIQCRMCDICGRDCKVVIDHCHQEEKPRGVLCSSCNAGLGQFRDRPEVLRRAAEYVERGGSGFFKRMDDAPIIEHA